MTPLLVGLGAAVGAALRFLAGRSLDRRVHWGTLAVNLVGSFVLGWLYAAGISAASMALLGTGFCGGLTTYSSFAVQSVSAPRWRGAAYVVGTVAGCLATGALGIVVGRL